MLALIAAAFFLIWLTDYKKTKTRRERTVFWIIFGLALIPSVILGTGINIPPIADFYEMTIKWLSFGL